MEAEATKFALREGVPLDRPAVEILSELAAEAVRLKNYLASRVEQLEELRYAGHSGEQIRGELAAYMQALDKAGDFVHKLARLGLDERQVKLDEARVVLLVGVVGRVLASPILGLDQHRQAVARELLASELETA